MNAKMLQERGELDQLKAWKIPTRHTLLTDAPQVLIFLFGRVKMGILRVVMVVVLDHQVRVFVVLAAFLAAECSRSCLREERGTVWCHAGWCLWGNEYVHRSFLGKYDSFSSQPLLKRKSEFLRYASY